MSRLTIENIASLKPESIGKNYILLIAIDKIPPHLGLAIEGQYFSVSSTGTKQGYSFNKIVQSIEKKKIPTLFIQVNNLFNIKSVSDIFRKYDALVSGASCLLPIREVFAEFSEKSQNAKFIYELIPILEEEGRVEAVFQLNSEGLLGQNHSFQLKEYQQYDIDKAILNAKQLC